VPPLTASGVGPTCGTKTSKLAVCCCLALFTPPMRATCARLLSGSVLYAFRTVCREVISERLAISIAARPGIEDHFILILIGEPALRKCKPL